MKRETGLRAAGLFAHLACAACAACVVGPDTKPPDLAAPDAYAAGMAGGEGPSGPAWWRGFEDGALNALVVDALSGNLTVGVAEARLEEALALARAERSDPFPRVDGFAEAGLTEGISGGLGSGQETVGGLSFGFVPDLFGRRRRELEAARAAAAAERFGLDDARRLVTAQVAGTYLELRRTDARLALLEDSLDLQNRTLEIVRLRAEAGLAADLDVQRALADLAQTRAQRGPLAASRAQADTLLAVLTARPPGEQLVEPTGGAAVPSYAGEVAAGVPADLLRVRPDLRAAEADLVAATARVGAEVADLYPSFSLPGAVTADIGSSEALAGGVLAAITAVLDVPLLDGGRRRAEVRAARARADAALLSYERALLVALRDVETALVAIESAEARRADLAVAVEASERAFRQLQALYTEGLASLIDVLDAQRQLITSREAFVNSEAELAASVVDFYTALGIEALRPVSKR